MKRLICLLLVLICVFSLCACGNKANKVNDAIQGTWSKTSDTGQVISVAFREGTCNLKFSNAKLGYSDKYSGKYEILDNTIKCVCDGKYWLVDYTYNDKAGTIVLWWKGDELKRS